MKETITVPPGSKTRKIEVYSTTDKCDNRPGAVYLEMGPTTIDKIIAEVTTSSMGSAGTQESFMVSVEFHLKLLIFTIAA